MSSKIIADTEDHITLEAISESATKIVPPGVTLVVVRSGILKHTIPVATNLVAMALNQDMKALIAIGEVTNKYLVYFIEGHNRSLLNAWTKSGCTVESIESSFMLNTLLPIPPGLEQQAIAAYLDRETARIDQFIAKVEAAISRLTEYRQALITAAVTGKNRRSHPDGGIMARGLPLFICDSSCNTLNVNHELIRWALERSGRSVEGLARQFPKLGKWERGEAQPTLKQLEALAKKTWTPLGLFFPAGAAAGKVADSRFPHSQ
ncbi:MAG: restriction endonuclease subunit S [Nitrosomonadales bacterium]